jgi:AraC-like DNA-binding protein
MPSVDVLPRSVDCTVREQARRLGDVPLSTHSEQGLARGGGSGVLVEHARRALSCLAERGNVRAELLARELGLGVRTLHRRLRAEGTSFRKLLVELQLARCRCELSLRSRSAKEIAFALGFADPASFHRAFKRWTGHTVAQFRRATVGNYELTDVPSEHP